MAETPVALFDTATLVFSRINGNKILARGHAIKKPDDGSATALEGQVFELRREGGSIVMVVKDKNTVPPPFTREQLRGAVRRIEAGDDLQGMSSTDLVEALAEQLGVAK